MFNPKSIIMFLALVMILLSTPISKAQKISLATGEWIPYTSANMDDKGNFTNKVSIVFQEMGEDPNYLFYPWRRCFDSVVKSRVWAAFPYSFTEKRAKDVWFSDMLSCSKTVFFYYDPNNGSKNFHFSRLEDLKPYQLGGVTGFFYEESFKKAGLSVDYVSKEINAIEKLKLGRIDLMPVNELVGWNLINNHFPADAHNFKTLPKSLSVEPLHLIVSKDYPGSKVLFDRFNEALKRCREKGLITIETCK